MRHQLSITVDEEVLSQLREYMRSGKYINKSHMFECAVKKMLENRNKEQMRQ